MWIKDIRDYILYEDKDILVCHKPAGLAVQNARVGSMDMESLLKNYIAQKVPGKMPYLGIIHRLDQPVEGVLVFALNPKAAADLSRQMTAGKIKKTYLAVTEGTVKVKSAKLVDWLGDAKAQTPWFDRVDTDLGNEFNNTAIGIANGDDVQEAFDTLQSYAESKSK